MDVLLGVFVFCQCFSVSMYFYLFLQKCFQDVYFYVIGCFRHRPCDKPKENPKVALKEQQAC